MRFLALICMAICVALSPVAASALGVTVNEASVNGFGTESSLNTPARKKGEYIIDGATVEGLIDFTARGPSLKANGFAIPTPGGTAQLEGFARFNTNNTSFQIRSNAACRPLCGNLTQVIFNMNLTGSVTQGSVPGRARASASLQVFGNVYENPNDTAFGSVGETFMVDSFDNDLSVNQLLSAIFWVRPGDEYSIGASLGLFVFAGTHFLSGTGSITADFGSTFTVADPADVFQYRYLDASGQFQDIPASDVLQEDSGWGLSNNQIPDLIPESTTVPVPPTAGLLVLACAILFRQAAKRGKSSYN